MIKIAICDDEQCFYDSIHRYINGYMSHRREECEVNIFSSGEELLGKMEASGSIPLFSWISTCRE